MKYNVLLKISVPDYELYIEMGKELNFHAHPNLTDRVNVGEHFCKITDILFDLDTQEIWIHIKSYETKWVYDSKEMVVARLKDKIDKMENDGWYLNIYDFGAEALE